jgi:DNA mismatch repair protein MutL
VAQATREAWEQLKGDSMSVLDLPPKPVDRPMDEIPRPVAPQHARLWDTARAFERSEDRPYTFAPSPSKAAETVFVEEPPFHYLGSFQDTYLLVEVQGEKEPELWIIDQHVAHERVQYERLFLRLHQPAIQPLLPPQVLSLGPAAIARITPWIEELNAVGIEVDIFSGDALLVRGLPDFLVDRDPQGLLEEVLTGIEDGPIDLDRFRRDLNATLACRASIKKNQRLPDGMALNLVRDLMACSVPQTCPHGRPIFKRLTLSELERGFGRRS